MSVAYIRKLQENTATLWEKYLKCRSHISGSFRKTPWHCAKWAAKLSGWVLSALCKMAAKLSGWTLSEDSDMYIRRSWNALLSHPASGAGCKISGECWTSPGQNSRCETSGWNGGGAEFRMWDIRVEWRWSRILDVIHPGGMAVRSPIRTPLGRSTRHSRLSHPRR